MPSTGTTNLLVVHGRDGESSGRDSNTRLERRRSHPDEERHQGSLRQLHETYQSLHQRLIASRRLRSEAQAARDGERRAKAPPPGIPVPTQVRQMIRSIELTLEQLRGRVQREEDRLQAARDARHRTSPPPRCHHHHHHLCTTKTKNDLRRLKKTFNDKQRNKKYLMKQYSKRAQNEVRVEPAEAQTVEGSTGTASNQESGEQEEPEASPQRDQAESDANYWNDIVRIMKEYYNDDEGMTVQRYMKEYYTTWKRATLNYSSVSHHTSTRRRRSRLKGRTGDIPEGHGEI
eukprot:5686629-Amphidinium_carterae.3